MRKAPFEKSVRFRELRISEDPKESRETEGITEPRRSTRQTEIAAGKTFARRPEFPLWGWKTKDFMCNTDLCRNHKFRCQLCTKEFKGR